MTTKIQERRDSAANWTSNNPVLDSGVWGFETNTGLVKIGDGSTAWTSLKYATDVTYVKNLGTGVGTFLATPSSANLASAVTDETGSGSLVFGTSPTLTTPTTNYALLKSPQEVWTVSATAATGTINFDVATQDVLYYTTDATGNATLNFRWDSGTSLASKLAVGSSQTLVFLQTNGATAKYLTQLQIDGNNVTAKWQGGAAPTAGNASAVDAYTVTIIKTAATPTYTVFASVVKFA